MSAFMVNLANDPLWDEAAAIGEARALSHIADRAAKRKPWPTSRGRPIPRSELISQDVQGAVAEAIVARLTGGEWDKGVGEQHWGGSDVRLPCGEVIEVKSTHHPNGRLFIYPDAPIDDYAVLVIVNFATRQVTLPGWVRVEDGISRAVFGEMSKSPPCYELVQEQLSPFADLLTHLEQTCLAASSADSGSR